MRPEATNRSYTQRRCVPEHSRAAHRLQRLTWSGPPHSATSPARHRRAPAILSTERIHAEVFQKRQWERESTLYAFATRLQAAACLHACYRYFRSDNANLPGASSRTNRSALRRRCTHNDTQGQQQRGTYRHPPHTRAPWPYPSCCSPVHRASGSRPSRPAPQARTPRSASRGPSDAACPSATAHPPSQPHR